MCFDYYSNTNFIVSPYFREISSSQMDFFKMLDEKIENVCTQFKFCNSYNIRRISEFPVAKSSWFKISHIQENSIKDDCH